ncbi:hypothetical protein M758_8G028800 [Ceratodon purpureus]|nr:hypothetical protein M758_8G028800 [Ceratodon purpureus]
MEDYPDTFQNGKVITLQGPSGNTWRVAALEKYILHPGWRAFSHDHQLREGDVLNFNLTKPSHFVVDIFNSNGDVRKSARKARVTGKYAIEAGAPALQDRSRKRKEIETGVPSNSDRCKTTSKRRNFNAEFARGPRLKFCERTKQWESHEQMDIRHEVVNLDTDDEEPKGQVRRRETSTKIERLIEFMREEEENRIKPESTPPVIQVVNLADEDDHQMVEKSHEDITGVGEENCVANEQHFSDDSFDDEKETASNPLRQFTKMFDKRPRKTSKDSNVERPATEVKKETLDTESDPLSRQAQITICDADTVAVEAASDLLSRRAQISSDQDTVMMKEEQEETHLVGVVHSDDVEVDNTLKHAGGAANLESSVAMSLPKSSPQPQKIEDRTIVDCTDEQRLRAQSSSPHVKNFSMISPNNILHSAMEASQKSCTDIQGIIEDHSNAASNNLVFESCKIDSMAQAAADYEPVTRKGDAHANSSQVTLPTRTLAMPDMYESKLSTLNSMSKDIVKIATVNSSRLQGKVQEAGECSSETLDKTVNVPVTETTISQELAKELDTLKLNEEEFKSINTEHDECMFQSASPSVALKDCQLQVTKTKPEEVQSILPVSENSNENEIAPSTDGLASQTRNEEISTAMTSGFETPATEEIELQLKSGNVADIVMKQTALKEVMVGNPQRKLEFKELIANVSDPKVTPDAAQVEEKHFNIQAKPTLMIKPDAHICTLISRRGQVAQGERDRALHLAQALANSKHPKPCFVAVMKSTHVYTDFNMVNN